MDHCQEMKIDKAYVQKVILGINKSVMDSLPQQLKAIVPPNVPFVQGMYMFIFISLCVYTEVES